MKRKRITLDFETRSACDLKKAGAYKYSLDPTTQPTCLAIRNNGESPEEFFNFFEINRSWASFPIRFRRLWRRCIENGYEFSAHNAFFETCIYKNILVKRYGWPDIPSRQFRCTAAKAAACALPRSLEGAGSALNLSLQKDKRGYAAMMATCKPTKQYNAWKQANEKIAQGVRVSEATKRKAKAPKPPMFLEYKDDPKTWETLYRYCKIDVLSEEALDDALPDLVPSEQEVWFLNQQMNWQGIRVDIETSKKIVSIMAKESKVKLKELDHLTLGLVTKPGARAAILEFLKLEGVELPDIRAKTVDDILKSGKLSGDMRKLLEIRKALSKTSTKKFQAFIDRASSGRLRDILLYHGASTGRDTGTGGVQLHNLAKPVIWIGKDRPYAAVENVIKYDAEELKLLYGENLSFLFSSIIRNMLIPTEGYELFVADLGKIEVCILWWLAKNTEGLKVIRDGKDPYIFQAAANTGKTYAKIEKSYLMEIMWAIDDRQLGKAQILGAGFRMGWKRFKETAYSQYRLKLTNRQSFEAIKSYREANAPVVELWSAYENAAVEAVETGASVVAGRCVFKLWRDFLRVKLPSGRFLYYYKPEILWKTVTYTTLEVDENGNDIEVEKTGRLKKTMSFQGLDLSKKNLKTEFMHGGIWAENITQAVARDVLIPALVRFNRANYRPLVAIHDEAVCERKKGEGSVDEFVKILCELPPWADESLPLEAKGWIGPRYRK